MAKQQESRASWTSAHETRHNLSPDKDKAHVRSVHESCGTLMQAFFGETRASVGSSISHTACFQTHRIVVRPRRAVKGKWSGKNENENEPVVKRIRKNDYGQKSGPFDHCALHQTEHGVSPGGRSFGCGWTAAFSSFWEFFAPRQRYLAKENKLEVEERPQWTKKVIGRIWSQVLEYVEERHVFAKHIMWKSTDEPFLLKFC